MVSFTCNVCQDVVKKPKIDTHCVGQCKNAWYFTCIDCNKTFEGYDYQDHTSCITEEAKYFGQFARAKKIASNVDDTTTTSPSSSSSSSGEGNGDSEKREGNGKARNVNGKTINNKRKIADEEKKEEHETTASDSSYEEKEEKKGEVKWDGSWKLAVEEVLRRETDQKMKWTDLSKRVVDLFLAANPTDTKRRRVADLQNECLASIPEKYLSISDEFVRIPNVKQ